ncbi:hypothetical protein [Streptomyces sp. NPDC048636]|uniref:hypothetical protein n=1 Tax=Streptomyces sp. NPDC048636 TaxID=3155762 RepID=UPI003436E2C9
MALTTCMPRPKGSFHLVEEWMSTSSWAEAVRLEWDEGPRHIALSPLQARKLLYGNDSGSALCAAVWRHSVRMTRSQAAEEHWRLLVVWLALPRLYRTVRRASELFHVDLEDVEAEAVLGILASLGTLDGEEPGLDDLILRAGYTHAWRFARRAAQEMPVADLASVAARRNTTLLAPQELAVEDAWEVDVAPPPRADGLSAPLRFTVSRTRVEGERLGSLADRLGLRDVIFRARRPGDGEPIGTLSLRPAGAKR